MKLSTSLIVLLLISLATSATDAAVLMLRESATQHGSIIRLGDVADISAATPSEVQGLATTPLFPAPAPGTQRFLTVAKLRDLLVARGIELSQLTIKGSLLVEIGEMKSAPSSNALVTPTVSAPVSPEQAERLVKQAIEQKLLATSTAGHWRVDVSLSASQLEKFETLGTNFTARELQPPRSGRIRFELQNIENGQDLNVVADITKIQSVVVAKQPIERGQLVRTVDVEVREREGNLPSGALTELQDVVGMVAQRNFKPDDLLQQSYLRAPWQVRRGETVSVYVRTGSILVRSRAVAKQNGAMGELITVETLEDEQRLDVTVSGPSEVTVYATGGSATDYASLGEFGSQRR